MQMTKREVVGRYKGSMMGLLWSFLNPLFMLVVYTFVFSVVFKAKWGGGDESRTQFAVILFAGMIVQALFADILNRASSLVLANANYVKKVVFPLEILVVITAGSAMFHGLVSIFVLLAAFFALNGYLHWTCIFFPLVFLPLIFLSTGLAWIISSIGVFARDVGQVVAIITTVLLFLSPVFFPVSALPAKVQPWIMANPLTFIIEQARAVMVWGRLPDFGGLSVYTAASILVAWAGYAWFQKTRKGFADVL
ncbi:ABC transporter permease [Xylophilus sp. Kf1]|nr:ABC transporter permease [Xylophilus sp. Kf1]